MERLRIYDEVIRLRRAGLGYGRISKVLEAKYDISLNPGAICNWVRGRHNPLRRCNKIVEGPELAYVIGGWLGDGKTLLGDGLSRDLTYCYTIC